MSTALSRTLLATGAAAGLTLLASGTAAAHVTAHAPEATQGGYAVVTFRVPTESVTASTTRLTVALPDLSSARTEPVAGWTATTEKNSDNEFTSVTWTASPGSPGIAADQFQRFVLAVGPLPEQDEVSFPATQTYSDGKVVHWDQPMPADGDEPEHPAPTVPLAAGGDSGEHHTTGSTSAGDHESDQADADNGDSDDTARWLGGIGLVLGALGAALGLGAVIRGRRA